MAVKETAGRVQGVRDSDNITFSYSFSHRPNRHIVHLCRLFPASRSSVIPTSSRSMEFAQRLRFIRRGIAGWYGTDIVGLVTIGRDSDQSGEEGPVRRVRLPTQTCRCVGEGAFVKTVQSLTGREVN